MKLLMYLGMGIFFCVVVEVWGEWYELDEVGVMWLLF